MKFMSSSPIVELMQLFTTYVNKTHVETSTLKIQSNSINYEQN